MVNILEVVIMNNNNYIKEQIYLIINILVYIL